VSAEGDAAGVVNLDDFEPLARRRLEPGAYAYYASGAADEITLKNNAAAFRRRRLVPRILVDVSAIDTSAEVLGKPVAMPVGMSPTGLHGLAHPDGEVASARAITDAGCIFCESTVASRSLEDVATACDGRLWFQLYVQKDRGFTGELIGRAVASGYEAIVFTADLPVVGYREGEMRVPLQIGHDAFGNYVRRDTSGEMMAVIGAEFDQALTWQDIEWVRSQTDLPLVLKGVMSSDDARLAVAHGVDAVIVSNHGGRQLDRTLASIDALPAVVDAVDGAAEVYLDGGVRRGADVAIALALGATAVFLGRPLLYALAVAGQEGVAHAVALLRAELENTMALLGTTAIPEITSACLAR
jgi:isopentenyl diphosphate isomerase/L-lactate dehydrogenase-like FMN-dependent dehydrogenase